MAHLSVFRKLGLSVAVCAVLFGTWASLARPEEPAPAPTPQKEEVVVPTRAAAPYATVGEWQGKLAVFIADSSAPTAVYDVFISSLPLAEQESLFAGITVYSETELQGLLEDYTG